MHALYRAVKSMYY